jgi:hypothetical protein
MEVESENVKTHGNIVLHFDKKDIQSLIEGERIDGTLQSTKRNQEINLTILPDISKEEDSEVVYDDLLDAMQETYSLLRYLFKYNGNPSNVPDNYNVEKIQNTYLHYRNLQKQYE